MTDLAAQIGQFATDAGFVRVAFASAKMILPAARYEDWLARGCHADMSYLAKNLPQRFHPDVLVPGATAVRLNCRLLTVAWATLIVTWVLATV